MAALNIHEASSSSSSIDYTYDVFLSFRGEDARLNYIPHLYRALTQRGVVTFLDEKSLERGKSITPEIEKSIRSSRFAIVVFSPNYAKSSWCMEELVEILGCMDAGSITVLPIFHGVNPDDVSNQTGTFALNSESSEESESGSIPTWKSVLTKAANLSGYDDRNRDEDTVIQEVVQHVLTKLSHISSNVVPGLVGMGMHMSKMKSLLQVGLNDVRMVGICGMGGIGKTTIAEQIYRVVSRNFDGCCFLERVREAMKNADGRSSLQKKLLASVLGLKPLDSMKPIDLAMQSKCVLIVLDDVDDIHHLEGLAGNHNWFGPGSRIILTSRNKQVLEAHRVDKVYEVELLSDLDSLKLFKHYAFRDSNETDELAALSQQAVNYANGLPLAVKVLGSSLTKKSVREWRDELDKLKFYPPDKVQSALQVSFHALNRVQQKIFLDIACFFNGENVDKAIDFWESCRLFPVSGLSSLQGKCLITVIDKKILMHDLLQEMGRNIVREESEDPGERSRLWDHDDVDQVLLENTGTNKIEGIVLDLSTTDEVNFKTEALSKMTKLRLLKIHCGGFPTVYEYPFSEDIYLRINPSERVETFPNFPNVLMDKFAPPVFDSVQPFRDLITFSNALRCLYWHGYPLEYLPKDFYPRNLVELNMSYSRMTKFWTDRKQFDRLKIINLCNSRELVATPNFSGIPNLEILILKGCTSLIEVHPSVGFLKNLQLLDLEGCESVQGFPSAIDMKSLQVLILSGCVKFELFPNILADMQHMTHLHLDGTALKELPDSIGFLGGLQVLSARNCKCLSRISISIIKLKALRILNFSGCSNLKELPENLGQLEDLEELLLDETSVTEPPTSIAFLGKLQILSFRGCPFQRSSSLKVFPPEPLFRPPLRVQNWISPLRLQKWISFNLSSLTDVDLSYCSLHSFSIPSSFSLLSSLRRLNISGNFFEFLPAAICRLQNLEVLHLAHCRFLLTLSTLPSSIYYIDASNCCRLLMVEYPAGVNVLCMRSFNFMNCTYLRHNIEVVAHHIRKTSMQLFTELSVIFPGSGIPIWSLHESTRHFAKMYLPKNWYDGTFKGLALWVVFSVQEPPLFDMNQQKKKTYRLDFELLCNKRCLIAENGFILSGETHAVSDHIWLRYFSLSTFKMTTFNQGSSEIEVFLKINGPDLVVKKCGLYPLCLDEENRTLIDIHSHSEKSAATTSQSREFKHPCHVFLSFNDEDIHFCRHLYEALIQIGVACDDMLLQFQSERSMFPDTKEIIQSARIAIVVISNSYVKSSWCLEELAEIILCMNAGSLTVLPIFHGVDPFDVHNQKGNFALNLESFKDNDRLRIPIWWDNHYRDESVVIEEVAAHVSVLQSCLSLKVERGLVGMPTRINKLLSLLKLQSFDVRIIGICGRRGIGKTIISEQIYHVLSKNFQGSCFLRCVCEAMKFPAGNSSLQRQILSAVLRLKPWDIMKHQYQDEMRSIRALIVLDDVEDMHLLEDLAGYHHWFGPGSRIIITSRNRQLLGVKTVDAVYEVEHLTDLESHILFEEHAFEGSNKEDELATLSQQVVNCAEGIPLAVKVLGSSLRNRTLGEWEDELEKLKIGPPNGVQSVVQVIFNGLDPTERKMFLDIACFFNGDCADKVKTFLTSRDVSALRSLGDKHLVSIVENKISMHHSLQEMGRKIVLAESEYPKKRSRLWNHEDVNSVLARLMVKKTNSILARLMVRNRVEGMVLDLSRTDKETFKFIAFARMPNLRLLKIYHAHLPNVYEYFPGIINSDGTSGGASGAEGSRGEWWWLVRQRKRAIEERFELAFREIKKTRMK